MTAEIARCLPELGPAAYAAFESRLRHELADPTRHRFRQFPNGSGTSDVAGDEQLLNLCRIAAESGGGYGEHH